jgi:hypothetical protein
MRACAFSRTSGHAHSGGLGAELCRVIWGVTGAPGRQAGRTVIPAAEVNAPLCNCGFGAISAASAGKFKRQVAPRSWGLVDAYPASGMYLSAATTR